MINASLMFNDGIAELHERRVLVLKELLELKHVSRVVLAHKVKVQWSIEGDENSGFFSWCN